MARVTYGSVVVCDSLVDLQDVHMDAGTMGRIRGSATAYKYDGSDWVIDSAAGHNPVHAIGGTDHTGTLPNDHANTAVAHSWHGSHPMKNAKDYGAVGDGIANDTAAMQAAIDAVKDTGDMLFIPVGTYLVDELLVNGSTGVTGTAPSIIGAGNQRSILKARTTSQLSVMRISQQHASVRDIRFDGADKADAGLLLHSAGFGSVYSCAAFNCLQAGFRFWNEAATPTGNNDGMSLINCEAWDNLVGYAVKVPTGGGLTDNNVIVFTGCNALSNNSHGMLLKGHGNIVIGGIFEANTGYGIRVGEAADSPTFWTGNTLLHPYFEGNTLGDIIFTQAVRNLYQANVAGTSVVDSTSTADNVTLSVGNLIYDIQPAVNGPATRFTGGGTGIGITTNTPAQHIALYTNGTGQLRLGQTANGFDGGPVVVGDDAGKIGFFGTTPIVRPAAYTPANVTTTRTYDANATTIDALSDVLGTLIADLKALGLLQ